MSLTVKLNMGLCGQVHFTNVQPSCLIKSFNRLKLLPGLFLISIFEIYNLVYYKIKIFALKLRVGLFFKNFLIQKKTCPLNAVAEGFRLLSVCSSIR